MKQPPRETVYMQDAFNDLFGRVQWGAMTCKCGFVAHNIDEAVKHIKGKTGHYIKTSKNEKYKRT